MAIRRSTDIVSLRQFLEKEDFLEDWRQPYLRKIEKMLIGKSPLGEAFAPTPTGGVLAKEAAQLPSSLISTSFSENSERSEE